MVCSYHGGALPTNLPLVIKDVIIRKIVGFRGRAAIGDYGYLLWLIASHLASSMTCRT